MNVYIMLIVFIIGILILCVVFSLAVWGLRLKAHTDYNKAVIASLVALEKPQYRFYGLIHGKRTVDAEAEASILLEEIRKICDMYPTEFVFCNALCVAESGFRYWTETNNLE